MVTVLNTGSCKHEIANPDGARWYDPTVGQWLSEDPTGLAADPNPYTYAGNGPTDFSDPSGLATVEQQDPAKFGAAIDASLSQIADQALKNQMKQLLLDMQKIGGVLGAITYDAIVHKKVVFSVIPAPNGFPFGTPKNGNVPATVHLGSGDLFGAQQLLTQTVVTVGAGTPGQANFPGVNPGNAALGTVSELPPVPAGPPATDTEKKAVANAQMIIIGHELAHAAYGTSDYFNPDALTTAQQNAIQQLNGGAIPKGPHGTIFGATQAGINPALENVFRAQLQVQARASYIMCPLQSQKVFSPSELDRVNGALQLLGVGKLKAHTTKTPAGKDFTQLQLEPLKGGAP